MNKWNKFRFGFKLFFIVRKTKALTKKAKYEARKIDLQYRTDYLVKKIKKVFKLWKINLVVKGYENLGNGPALLVANHQDNIDAILILYALKKQTESREEQNKIATFLAKHTLQYNKVSRNILGSIDTFFLDRNDIKASLETYQNFGKFIKENKTFGVIFPEGTRNREGTIGEFKPGAFKVAKKELLPIIPVTINNSVQGANFKRNQALNVEVIFHKKIPASSLMTQNTFAISERVYNTVKSAFKSPELPFVDVEVDEAILEQSKGAQKWKNQEIKREQKLAKKEQRELKQEQRLLEAEKREDEKYEKYQAKIDKKKQKVVEEMEQRDDQ